MIWLIAQVASFEFTIWHSLSSWEQPILSLMCVGAIRMSFAEM